MQISKLKLKKNVTKEMMATFYQTIADLKGKEEVKIFINDFLTKMEKAMLAKRLMTAAYLEQEKSYDFIKQNLKISSATIANVDKMMTKNSQGFTLALRKIEAEHWASDLAKKIAGFINNFISNKKFKLVRT